MKTLYNKFRGYISKKADKPKNKEIALPKKDSTEKKTNPIKTENILFQELVNVLKARIDSPEKEIKNAERKS